MGHKQNERKKYCLLPEAFFFFGDDEEWRRHVLTHTKKKAVGLLRCSLSSFFFWKKSISSGLFACISVAGEFGYLLYIDWINYIGPFFFFLVGVYCFTIRRGARWRRHFSK